MKKDRLKILLVDDSETDYTLTKEYLAMQSDYDIEIEWEKSYDSGLEKMVEKDYDACLVDYNIGAYSGLDLARVAREEGAENPIILFSGMHQQQMSNMVNGSQIVEGVLSKDDLSTESILLEMQKIMMQRLPANLETLATSNAAPQTGTEISIGNIKPVQALDENHVSQFVLENLPDPIMVLDREGTITMVNQKLSQLKGLSPEELLGVNASTFLNCTKETLIRTINSKHADLELSSQVKDKNKKRMHITWEFVKPSQIPNEEFTVIAKGNLNNGIKRKPSALGGIARLFGRLFKDPSYYEMNGVYIRKDTL